MEEKQRLRRELRERGAQHVAQLSASTRALLFLRPPAPLAELLPTGGTIGLYHATADEAPTQRYAHWLYENGRKLALPWFAARGAPMEFRAWSDPWEDAALVPGPYGAMQPHDAAELQTPDALIVPLVGFTALGQRLGQGGGHYDLWLSNHPQVPAIGLAWDCQLLDALPLEAHDQPLRAVVTPTRFYESASDAQ